MSYEIRECTEKDYEDIFYINRESKLFATAQFMTSPISIHKTIKNSKKLFLVASDKETDETVGYILGKMRTKGVFFNELLGVKKPHRRKGIGGGLIISLLKLINKRNINSIPNKFYAWKWFAEVPTYNYEALQMYNVLKFQVEGILKRHTSAKTDIYMIAFLLDESNIPEHGKHVNYPAKIEDKTIFTYLNKKHSKEIKETTEESNSKANLKNWLK